MARRRASEESAAMILSRRLSEWREISRGGCKRGVAWWSAFVVFAAIDLGLWALRVKEGE